MEVNDYDNSITFLISAYNKYLHWELLNLSYCSLGYLCLLSNYSTVNLLVSSAFQTKTTNKVFVLIKIAFKRIITWLKQ